MSGATPARREALVRSCVCRSNRTNPRPADSNPKYSRTNKTSQNSEMTFRLSLLSRRCKASGEIPSLQHLSRLEKCWRDGISPDALQRRESKLRRKVIKEDSK